MCQQDYDYDELDPSGGYEDDGSDKPDGWEDADEATDEVIDWLGGSAEAEAEAWNSQFDD